MISIENLKGKKIAVLGLGRTGISVSRSLLYSEVDVIGWDDNEKKRDEARRLGIEICNLEYNDWYGIASLVLSPGVSSLYYKSHPIIVSAINNKVPIMSDIDLLFLANPNAFYIGVTGTNGKSTTTALIGHLLKTSGFEVEIGGNIGIPVLDLENLGNKGVYILELSSYQLEIINNIQFKTSVLLNISIDHIEHHGTVENYFLAKKNIFKDKVNRKIIGVDDCNSEKIYYELKSQNCSSLIPISGKNIVKNGIYVKEGILIDNFKQKQIIIADLNKSPMFLNDSYYQNVAASYAAVVNFGLKKKEIVKGLFSFKGLPYRMEKIRILNGITFINDSKSTNLESAVCALLSFKKIYWIAGGKIKQYDINISEKFLKNVKSVFLIGESTKIMSEILSDNILVEKSYDLEIAVRRAYVKALSDEGENSVILFSPAFASFDQFKDYEDRGKKFNLIVEDLS